MKTLFPKSIVLAALALLTAVSCKKAQSTAVDACPSADAVVATVGNAKITWAELDERVGAELHEKRQQTLEQMVSEKLVDNEAKKRGVTQDQFFKAEVDDKLQMPTDAELKTTFDQAQGQLPPGATFEQFKPRIVDYMMRPKKQERMKEVIEGLKKDNPVALKLPRPRKQVEATGPMKGPEGAQVTIVEFSDFECPFCSRASETVQKVMEAYNGKVKLVFRHFPLEFHANAKKAAEAAMCANEQKKFWEMHDVLFQNQKALAVDQLKQYATQIGLDLPKFNTCLDSGAQANTVQTDAEAGKKAGVTGTPAFFINGVFINGAQPFEQFKAIIDQELTGA
jgi:protein-disulfide isomerase